MIEYLDSAIYASYTPLVKVTARITDEKENLITDNCVLNLLDDNDKLITKAIGIYYSDVGYWEFMLTLPTDIARGRYFYIISHNENDLNFRSPLYLI